MSFRRQALTNSSYPFGMLMPNRTYQALGVDGYRFGFNGQEQDDEIVGDGDYLAFKYRIHDARLGRFLSVDPLEKEYPWNSTYAFAENQVIWAIDLEGAESNVVIYNKDDQKTTHLYFPQNGRYGSGTMTILESHQGVHSVNYSSPIIVGSEGKNYVGKTSEAHIGLLDKRMQFKIWEHQNNPKRGSYTDELVDIAIASSRPFTDNFKIEGSVSLEHGISDASILRIFGFQIGEGTKSNVGFKLAELNVNGSIPSLLGEESIFSQDYEPKFYGEFKKAEGFKEFHTSATIDFLNDELNLEIGGSYKGYGPSIGNNILKQNNLDVNGSYSILDLSQSICRGFTINSSLNARIDFSGFWKDVLDVTGDPIKQ